MKKWVYTFDEVSEAEALAGDWDSVRGLLGGKGANLSLIHISEPTRR